MKLRIGFFALVVSLMFGQSAFATNIDIVGGQTDVDLTSLDLFADLGLDLGLVGSATISGSTVTFPITGGSVDMDGFAQVEHDGSGISISDGATMVTLENFLVDTALGNLSGDVFVNGSSAGNIALFDISSSAALLLTSGAASALSDVFEMNFQAGTEIGIADVQPQLVPIPGAAILMLSGLLGLFGVRKTA